MKTALLLFALVVLWGCSSQAETSAPPPSPNAGLTPQQNMEKIKSDPNIPEGLKKIQTETLQGQPGVNR